MLKTVDSVVVVLVVAAALLAFVVLYNLTNINITERAREIATLKSARLHLARGGCVHLPRKPSCCR